MDVIATLARKRVALGFVTALVAVIAARPSPTSLQLGFAVAVAGEALRVWAAGHLEKSREVTRSGPYRWTRHPLYAGSAVIALGVVIAARSIPLALLTSIYMAATIGAALQHGAGDAEPRVPRGERRAGRICASCAQTSRPDIIGVCTRYRNSR